MPFGRAGVVAGRPDDLVVLPLLEDMGTPAGDAAGGEDAREQLSRNPHVMLQAGRIEIDVAVLVNRFLDDMFQLDGDVVPLRLPLFETEPARSSLRCRARGSSTW